MPSSTRRPGPGPELSATSYEVRDGVAVLTLDRPHRHNAWTGRMHTEYRALLARSEADPAVAVTVVTGRGDVFCVGADSRALDGHVERGGYDPGTTDDLAEPGYGVAPELDHDFAFQFGLTKPVIAAVNGAAAGVGLVVALYADIRFAARGAKITTAHGKIGLAAEYGLSWLIPRLIGLTRANDLLLSSRTLRVEETEGWGLFNQIVEPDELMPTAMTYARMLATAVAPSSLAATKRQIALDLHRDLGTSVAEAALRLEEMTGGADFAEGVRALIEKRPPRFGDSREP